MNESDAPGNVPNIEALLAKSAPRPPVTFRLANRKIIDLNAPDPSLLTLDLIALGLGNTCRYSGQIVRFYSVAEHSIHVARHVPAPLRLAALLHDASEGLGMSDVIGPLKVLLPEYKAIEDGLMRAVERAFELPARACDHPLIKEADRRMLRTEQLVLRGVTDEIRLPREHDVEPYDDVRFASWSPMDAADAFVREVIGAMGSAAERATRVFEALDDSAWRPR